MAVTKSQHAGGQKGDTAAVADVRHLKSPLEINLIRLMHKCEQRALDGSAEVATDWRQHTYIACLRDFLKKLQGIVFEKLCWQSIYIFVHQCIRDHLFNFVCVIFF